MIMKRLAAVSMMLALALPAMAAESGDQAAIRAALAKAIPQAAPDRIVESALPGLYEVSYGAQILYISKDGRHLLHGDLIDLKTEQNLTEQSLAQIRLGIMAQLDEKSMIIYPAKGETKHVVTVFTDTDCGYCRKLHSGMARMNELGIEVRYLAFPRAGLGSPSYNKAVSVWCADDQKAAMDIAKAGDEPPTKTCDNPVADHMQLARTFGITGTPSILLDNGDLLPGYLPPEQLLKTLDERAAATQKTAMSGG